MNGRLDSTPGSEDNWYNYKKEDFWWWTELEGTLWTGTTEM